MAKSILQDKKDGRCYLCRLLHRDYSIKTVREEHHALGGTANRKLSERYGLKVYLCPDHHQYGPEAVHKNAEVAELLHKEAQKAFEKNYPKLDFLEIFGRNYLTEAERAYERNKEFRRYVDRYCASRGISLEDALRHELAESVRREYEGGGQVMREIIFRGKRVDGLWVAGGFSIVEECGYIIQPHIEYKDDGQMELQRLFVRVNPNTVCQYTGLTDKNGWKIFEGDILKCGEKFIVKWSEKYASWCLTKKGWAYAHFFGEACEAKDCEVIGNIFDNPELCKNPNQTSTSD